MNKLLFNIYFVDEDIEIESESKVSSMDFIDEQVYIQYINILQYPLYLHSHIVQLIVYSMHISNINPRRKKS